MRKRIEFRKATREDALFVAERLREADLKEVSALGLSPEEAVEHSRQISDYCRTALIDGVPAMLFGCGCSLCSSEAEVWALGTDACSGVPREMLIYGRRKLGEMLEMYPEMHNYCDARYKAALRWLKKLGFTVHPEEPHGANGELFCRITICREA